MDASPDDAASGRSFDAGQQPSLAGSPGIQAAGAAGVPADFVRTEIGGYKLGAMLPPGSADLPVNDELGGPRHCSIMTAVVRDFRGAREASPHPDFDVFDGKKPTTGLVRAMLGADRKPTYASRCEADFDKTACPEGQMTTSQQAFDEWYRTTPDVNIAFLLSLAFEPHDGVYTIESKSFFPLDGKGFGNGGGKKNHNFGFTTELHGTFAYRGGEELTFTGDDDLWVFINGHLAIDLGGLHPPASQTIALDTSRAELGIEPGHEYSFELFHAERHFASSNFRVDTTIEFRDCGQVTPELL